LEISLDQDQDLKILRAILHGRNYDVVKLVYNNSVNSGHSTDLTSKDIRQKIGLSRKQIYSSISALKEAGVITREHKSCYYRLTDIAFEIIKYIDVIEEVEAQRLQYKLKEIVIRDTSIAPDDKDKFFGS
jgi:DNA-binding transcriptional ArsR family regulator